MSKKKLSQKAEVRGEASNKVIVDDTPSTPAPELSAQQEAELKEVFDKPVELSKVTEGYPVLEVNYPTEPTFEEREAVARPMTFDSFNEGLVKQVEEGKSIIGLLGEPSPYKPDEKALLEGLGITEEVPVDETPSTPAPVLTGDMAKGLAAILENKGSGLIDVIWGPDLEVEPPAEHIEDEVVNKVVLEQAIEQTVQPISLPENISYNFDTDENFTEDVRTQEGKRWVSPPAEKLELKNTSPYAANIQEIKISEDFNREALNELGKVGPYNRYASFPEVPEKQLPPVTSLVAPKSVKAIEQAPVVNNGGTVVPQAPQAQPVGRQRHTFKARPDKEGRNV